MRANEFTLNEVANNPYDYELDNDSAQFIDKDGNSYSIKFMRIESGVFAVAFSSGIFVDQKTNRHDSFRIFATVIDAIKSYATKNQVAMIVFSANKSEPNRVNLYKKLALAFTRNSNYKLIEHSKEITDAALKDRIQYLFWYLKTKDFTPFMLVNRKFTNEQGLAESASGKTPSGYTWSFEPGDKVPWKSEVEVNTFIRVKDDKGKTVLGVWADVYNDTVEVQYSEVFDKKLRGKGIYTDFLKGLSKHYNIISDQDNNNAAREIYKKLGAAYDHKTKKHTLSRPNQGVTEGFLDKFIKPKKVKPEMIMNIKKGNGELYVEVYMGEDSTYWIARFTFDMIGDTLKAQDISVTDEYRGRGIAKWVYDTLKNKGYTINRSPYQTDDGKHFWDKNKGANAKVWEQGLAEGTLI
jgi:predicted GNAT family acetyltransferase